MSEVEATGEPVEGTVVDEEPVTVETRPGEEGSGVHTETVSVYNEDLDAVAEIPLKALELWQEQGWVEDTGEEEDVVEDDEGDDTSE